VNVAELMAEADEETYRHNLVHSRTVPVDRSVSAPHNGVDSDLEAHHVLVCAPPSVDDALNARLYALVQDWKASNSIA
jgi:hypothetical protein